MTGVLVGYFIGWVACMCIAAAVSSSRGNTPLYGVLLVVFSLPVPFGPVLAVIATERWTREP